MTTLTCPADNLVVNGRLVGELPDKGLCGSPTLKPTTQVPTMPVTTAAPTRQGNPSYQSYSCPTFWFFFAPESTFLPDFIKQKVC